MGSGIQGVKLTEVQYRLFGSRGSRGLRVGTRGVMACSIPPTQPRATVVGSHRLECRHSVPSAQAQEGWAGWAATRTPDGPEPPRTGAHLLATLRRAWGQVSAEGSEGHISAGVSDASIAGVQANVGSVAGGIPVSQE